MDAGWGAQAKKQAWERENGGADARVIAFPVSQVEPSSVEWLWHPRIPRGKLAVVDGDPGLGKSTLLLDLAARVSSGGPMPSGGEQSDPAAVIILSAEDDPSDTIRPRLELAGANLDNVILLTALRGEDGPRPPELPDDVPSIEALVREHNASLVIIDPLMAYLGGEMNAHRDQHVRRALAPLSAMANVTDAAVVVIRHLNKGSAGQNPIYRGGGSIGIIGAARTGLLVAEDPDDPTCRVLAMTKSNVGPPAPSLRFRTYEEQDVVGVSWLGECNHASRDLLAEPEERTARTEAQAFLEEALREGPQLSRPLKREAREAGIAERTLERAKAKLGVLARKTANGWQWSLPNA